MINTEISALLAGERARDITIEATRRRLVAIATCCRPSYVAAKLADLRDRLRHRSTVAACC